MSDFCKNCNPHSSYHTTAVGECLVDIWLQKYVNWLCVILEVNPCFQKAHVFCMDLQPAADPYNVVCNFLYTCEKGNLLLVNLTFVVTCILSCQHLLSRSFYNKNKSIFTIIFWADNHAFRTAAMFDNISSSQNQNKKLVPTRISQIAQTNSFT